MFLNSKLEVYEVKCTWSGNGNANARGVFALFSYRFYVFLCFRALSRQQRQHRVSSNKKKMKRYNALSKYMYNAVVLL